ncbi:MAG: carbohydrate binding family 9 domain-containing protein [Flavobacteriaceae bacterium]|nr:carbohydrate binding family 9 domain-containing protein [Flavobacteriaceae bacterium]
MRKLLFPLLLLGIVSALQGQMAKRSFMVKKINETIVPDGELNEPAWQTAESANDFWQYFPVDSIQAEQQSEIKMLYDDKNLYVGIKVLTAGKNYAIQTLKRDFRAGNSDNITLLFDTFNDGNNAFLFGSNPYGVRREGLVSGGGINLRGFTISWDVKWQGESKIYDGYYITEWVIPMAAFKFREGVTKWGLNSYRFDTQSNETSTWMQIPQNQNVFGLTFMGDMVFQEPLGNSKTPLAIIPYGTSSAQKDYELDESDSDFSYGGDMKIAIGNSLNLDITGNPDFSQVEVDDQITNLTRFEVSLPEKRQFFIDNNDLFASFGGGRDANPFFSRRIGIAEDTAGNTIENRILAGARLSGKLNKDLRLGFFNIVTDEDEANEIAGNNNTMLAFQQQVFTRSNIGLFFINRQSLRDYDFQADEDRYNRVLGVDYNLISQDNKWSGKAYMHKAFSPGIGDENLSAGMRVGINTRFYSAFTDWVYLGEDFRSDLGFIRRTNILKSASRIERTYWPKDRKIQTHSFRLFPIFYWDPANDLQNTDYNIMGSWNARFRDFSNFEIEWSSKYTYLFDEFDPTGTDGGIPIPGDRGYYYSDLQAGYQSDRRRLFSFDVRSTYGNFYNGERLSLRGGINMRFQPKMFFSLNFNYDKISLPDPHPSADIWLISPKFDITFSRTLFWSTLVQYSNQRDNLGINSRLQWRFAPLSDLYLVYNDNYYVNSFAPKVRSINLKLTYWLNI